MMCKCLYRILRVYTNRKGLARGLICFLESANSGGGRRPPEEFEGFICHRPIE